MKPERLLRQYVHAAADGYPLIYRRRSRGPTYGVQIAAVENANDEVAIENAKQQTHDLVVEMLGGRRSSAVTWSFHEPGPEASRILDTIDNATDREQITRLRDYLEQHPDGLLVLAMAEERAAARCRRCGSRDLFRNRKGELLCRKCGRPVPK